MWNIALTHGDMGMLYLIHDFSSSAPWLHATFHANRALLAEEGLEFGPFDPFTCQVVPSHDHLWAHCENPAAPSTVARDLAAQIEGQLAGGKDVLLFATTPFLEQHKGFHRLLREYIGVSPVRALFIIGRPLLSLEQRHRQTASQQPAYAGKLAAAYWNLHALVSEARETLGEANVELLANMQEDPQTTPRPDIAEEVRVFLQRGRLEPSAEPSLHPLCYASRTARVLCWTPEVRRNAWPPLDEAAFARTLLDVDSGWGTDIASPLALRKKFQQESAADRVLLEQALGLAPRALDAPQWLLEQEETGPDAPLARERVRHFASRLPADVGATLLARFRNDEPLLSEAQGLLFTELKELSRGVVQHIGEPEQPVELTVLTMTYNHEEYIEDCLKSVLAQKTDFPVRHIVLDHCSSDATPAILSEYAKTHPSIQPVLLSRRKPAENVRGLFLRCRTKYAALCDGDDFFSDLHKLQKQVDFLETHENCALCFHPVAVLFEDGHQPFVFPSKAQLPRRSNAEYYLADLTKGNFIQTNSVMYRWRFADGLPSWFRSDICPADWYWHMLHAEKGRIGFLPEVMAVYRRHGNAMYAKSFVDPLAHWRVHGMSELHALKAYNDHFENRYFRNFSALAELIFVAYVQIAAEDGDSTLLDKASEAYPQFALEFFRNANKHSQSAPAGTQN